MFGKTTGLTDLETRKQLLLLESELNRVELLTDIHELKRGVHHWTSQARAIGAMASSAAQVGTTVAGFFRGWAGQKKSGPEGKPSLISTIFNGTRAGISLWSALRSYLR